MSDPTPRQKHKPRAKSYLASTLGFQRRCAASRSTRPQGTEEGGSASVAEEKETYASKNEHFFLQYQGVTKMKVWGEILHLGS